MAYPGDLHFFSPESSLPPGQVQVYLQGVYSVYQHGTAAQVWNLNRETELSESHFWPLLSQRPDSITFPYPANADGASGAVAVTVHGATPRYVGGSWCDPA